MLQVPVKVAVIEYFCVMFSTVLETPHEVITYTLYTVKLLHEPLTPIVNSQKVVLE